MSRWMDAVEAASLADESAVGLVLEGVPVAIFRLGEEFFALHDRCPHGAAKLSEGYIDDVCVECPLHQGLVDIRTGAARSAPITEATRSYVTRVVDGMVQVALD